MSLYLVQHGKCLSKTENPAQPLSPEGTREVNRIAEVAKNYRINVSSIEHSVKERAKQTAEILAGALDPAAGVVEKTGLKPMDDVQAVASRLHSGENKMLVGHLPFMEKLTSYLTTGCPKSNDFPNGSMQNIVCCPSRYPAGDPGWAP